MTATHKLSRARPRQANSISADIPGGPTLNPPCFGTSHKDKPPEKSKAQWPRPDGARRVKFRPYCPDAIAALTRPRTVWKPDAAIWMPVPLGSNLCSES